MCLFCFSRGTLCLCCFAIDEILVHGEKTPLRSLFSRLDILEYSIKIVIHFHTVIVDLDVWYLLLCFSWCQMGWYVLIFAIGSARFYLL